MKTKGIILAGGFGSRLFPVTKVYSKQLVAVYDKPLLYYPLTTLINSGITEILIISDASMLELYRSLFGDGSELGLCISYLIQERPNGIAEAFIIGKDFIGQDRVCLILGDNIFCGADSTFLNAINQQTNHIFALYVNDPHRYGVVKFDSNKNPLKIIEKPTSFVSNYAVPGFYIYGSEVVKIAENLVPSNRNELEITDINNIFLNSNNLSLTFLNRDIT